MPFDGPNYRNRREQKDQEKWAFLLHLLEFARLLDATQRRNDQIEPEQQDVRAILVEEQSPTAGNVAMSADIVKPLEQRRQPVEVLQSNDVALANLAGSLACHSTVGARTNSNAPEQNAVASRFRVERRCASTVPNGVMNVPFSSPLGYGFIAV